MCHQIQSKKLKEFIKINKTENLELKYLTEMNNMDST